MESHKIPPCVNWHITKSCNYNCVYCFAKFNGVQGTLPKRIAMRIPEQLKELGVEKLNIAGGEPLLYPHLMDIAKEASRCGLVVSLISNGSLITDQNIGQLSRHIDWIGLSLDSCDESVQHALGRGICNHVSQSISKAQIIKDHGLGLKINTVVTKLNMNEDMRPLIRKINPDRWKVFQVMERVGENDHCVGPLLISEEEFDSYSNRNQMVLDNGCVPRFENNELMSQSYFMLDPLGRFFHSASGRIEHIPTDPLDLQASAKHVPFDKDAFLNRGGIYDWNRRENTENQISMEMMP